MLPSAPGFSVLALRPWRDRSTCPCVLADVPVAPKPVVADGEMFKPVVSPSRTCSTNICCARLVGLLDIVVMIALAHVAELL